MITDDVPEASKPVQPEPQPSKHTFCDGSLISDSFDLKDMEINKGESFAPMKSSPSKVPPIQLSLLNSPELNTPFLNPN